MPTFLTFALTAILLASLPRASIFFALPSELMPALMMKHGDSYLKELRVLFQHDQDSVHQFPIGVGTQDGEANVNSCCLLRQSQVANHGLRWRNVGL